MAVQEKLLRHESGMFIISKDEDQDFYSVRRWQREQPVIVVELVNTPDEVETWRWGVDGVVISGDFSGALSAACHLIEIRHEEQDKRSQILSTAYDGFTHLGDYDPGTT